MARSNYSTLYKSSHSVVSVETLSSSSSAVLTILYNIYLLTYLSILFILYKDTCILISNFKSNLQFKT